MNEKWLNEKQFGVCTIEYYRFKIQDKIWVEKEWNDIFHPIVVGNQNHNYAVGQIDRQGRIMLINYRSEMIDCSELTPIDVLFKTEKEAKRKYLSWYYNIISQ